MFLLLTYLYNKAPRIVPGILILLAFGCSNKTTSTITVSPKHFRFQTPFLLDGRGIIINTYWGSEKKHHVLCLDNYSPSWIKSSLIQYNYSFKKSNLSFKSSTADGSPIQGDVGICDSLFFGNIVFSNVPFYVMPENLKDNKNDDGVFGIDVMSKGVWMIDFKNSVLSFASSIDSFEEIKQAEVFPATFNQKSITVSVDFGNSNVKTMAIDLGYNDYMLLPVSEFRNISQSKKVFFDLEKFTTPVSENVVNSLSFLDTVHINHNWFFTIVSSNETVKEKLIGLTFFRRFDYVIFDFIDKRIYVPKKVW